MKNMEKNLKALANRRRLAISAIDIVEKEQRSLQMFYRLSANQKPPVKYIISVL